MRDSGAAGRRGSGVASSIAQIAAFLRTLAGMPDYAAHLEHLRHSHPDQLVPTEREFYEEFIRRRYDDGPTRCC